MGEVMATVENYRMSLSEERRELFDRYELVDVARRRWGWAAWVPAAGWRSFEATRHPARRPIVLQVKEAQPSVLEPYVGPPPSSTTASGW